MSCPRLEDSIVFWLVEIENNQTKNNLNFFSLSIRFLSLFEKYNVRAKS